MSNLSGSISSGPISTDSIFSGLSAFSVTPADEQGIVNCDLFGRLIERLAATDVDSIGVLGSTGCYMYLSTQQRKRALESAIEAADGKPVVAGVGAFRTSDVCDLTQHAEQVGARGALLAPVSYLPLNDADVTSLFKDVSASTDLPVCFYYNPVTTHFSLSEKLLVRLAQGKCISAVKNPPPADLDFAAQMARLRTSVPTGFSLGYSGDARIAAAISAGCDSWYSVVAGTMPNLSVRLWNARGDQTALDALNAKLQPLWDVFDVYGGIRVVHEMVRMLGLGTATLPQPLLPLKADACKQIESALDHIKALESTS